ncbi:peptide-methionine (S)-S-oxide reductase MsrA [uncultured Maritalea sp.]|uniref:peptide-methionine (S)-S-oxide reductase MsrA n=1 Tax=uncultured Maritalea sp. TaxID=757249 RepID=UPI00261661BA|nr:peptide-methionine (S)-S-oxide reductase MsrA [uncultured Maritalea sp.]
MRILFNIGVITAILLAGTAAQAGEKAIFAGGCFWCVECDFEQVTGVIEARSGYTGGTVENPTYKQVTAGNTGHFEAVEIEYDETVIAYSQLVDIFFRSVDPTDADGQFCDRGDSYRTAIFALDDGQLKVAADAKRQAAIELKSHVATIVQPAMTFYPAEGYHQDYYKKNKLKYSFYRFTCGRNKRVEQIWGKRAYQGIKDH